MEWLLTLAPIVRHPGRILLLPLAFLMPPNRPHGQRLAAVSIVPAVVAKFGSASPLIYSLIPVIMSSTRKFRLPLLIFSKLFVIQTTFQAFVLSAVEICTWNFVFAYNEFEAAMVTQLVSFFTLVGLRDFLENKLSGESAFNVSVVLLTALGIWIYRQAGHKTPIALFSFTALFTVPSSLMWLLTIPGSLVTISCWFASLLAAIPWIIVARQGTHISISRKYFHFLIVGILLPPILISPEQHALISSASLFVTCAFLFLEVVKKDVPFVAHIQKRFVDSKGTTGTLAHIALLIGCVLPIWLNRAGQPRVETFSYETLLLGAISAPDLERGVRLFHQISDSNGLSRYYCGIVLVGLSDAFAAIAGLKSRRAIKMPGSVRTVQGFAAFVLSACLAFGLVQWQITAIPWLEIILVGLYEVYTTGMDNLLLPLYFLAL